MSAIRESLGANMRQLRLEIDNAANANVAAARPDAYRSLTEAQLDALKQAADDSELTIELRLGPTTSIGAESRANSILGKLRAELQSSPELGGRDVLATGAPTRVDPKYIDAASRGETGNPK